jgi:hypothetical protein
MGSSGRAQRLLWDREAFGLTTTPTAEKPALSDEERAERRRLIERVFSPDGWIGIRSSTSSS